jgi:hypothetical protein
MRLLARNLRTFYFSLYQGEEEIIDEDGNSTGEFEQSYSEPILSQGNISASRGEASSEMFGLSLNYNKVLMINGIDSPISETTRLWIENQPTESHDYIVVQVAKSLNSTSFAIKKVDVNNG